ncbi:DUF2730 family protein [Achromobacter insolitus]|uniref:DUF2730 family protein n=1 Tax=Achromobacter insolitus TaxID=217204 RepID=UPI001EEDA1CA|nr:DUF2730 domain-containing protein [Achromobacter insolitus]
MMEIDFKFLAATLQWIVSGAVAFYAYMAKRDAANAADVNDLRQRVTALEEQMRHLPDQTLVNELAGDMKAVKVGLEGIREAISPLARSVDRINDYLLAHK